MIADFGSGIGSISDFGFRILDFGFKKKENFDFIFKTTKQKFHNLCPI